MSVSGATNSFQFAQVSSSALCALSFFDSEDKSMPVKVALRDTTPNFCIKLKVTVSTIDVTPEFALTFPSLLDSTFSCLL